uniref:VWFA domain-containing protein n=1 Tax=Eutreptiella gymnastica TaxID=73025 RepID=A0A7S1NJR4_9EUGL|mmetsp:Transcript_46371/g.82887  ORF Transcript_46371/g.82887 Transcript_46371/m.82887 type:complete len:1245 (+) Transcript_46371:4829-8563(+)
MEGNKRILASDAVQRVRSLQAHATQFTQRHQAFVQDARKEIIEGLIDGLDRLEVNSDLAMLLENYMKVKYNLPLERQNFVDEAIERCCNNVEGMTSSCRKALKDFNLNVLNMQQFVLLLKNLRTLTASNERTLKQCSNIQTLQSVKDIVDKEIRQININQLEQKLEQLDYTAFFNQVAFLVDFENEFSDFFQCPKPPIQAAIRVLEKNVNDANVESDAGNYGSFNKAVMVITSIATATEQHRSLRSLVYSKAHEHRRNILDKVAKRLNNKFVSRASSACQHVDFANSVVPYRKIANDAPVLHEKITATICELLDGFKARASAEEMALLTSYLIKGCEVCRQIGGENEAHFASALHERWGTRGQLSVEDCCNRLDCEPPLSSTEKIRLRNKLQEYKDFIEKEKKEFFNGAMSLEQLYQQKLATLKSEVSTVKTEGSTDALGSLVNQVAAMFTLYHLMQSSGTGYAMAPHTTQIVAVYRLLGIECQTGFWGSLFQRFRAIDAVQSMMIQILTGEGKSVTLGLLAAVLGLLGVEVDVVCYSEYLTERDAAMLLPFFNALQLPKDTVRYLTFEKLCALRLEGVPALVKELVETAQLTQATAATVAKSKPRMLLIDEVDVFFSRRFYGEVYNAGISLKSPNISKLVRLVYSKRGQAAFQVTETQEFKAVAADYDAKLLPILQTVAQQLVINSSSSTKPAPEFQNRVVGYRPPGAAEVQWGVVYPNKTLFVYLEKEEHGCITTDEVEQHLCLDITFGQFSYAEVPLKQKYYCGILGVTGTLRAQKAGQSPPHMILTKDEERILKEEYNVKAMTFVPSVFGESKRNFEFNRDVYRYKNLSDWACAIEKDAHVAKKQGGVLVFFKNETTLREFHEMRKETLGNVQILTHETSVSGRKGIIAAATTTGKITLSTRPYGRGVDFSTLADDAVTTVIITFFSSSESEEVQIMGRTARQGQKGNVLMHLAIPHLEDKFQVTLDDLDRAKGSPGDTYRKYLTERRMWKCGKKTEGRSQRRKTAKIVDTQSWALVAKLMADGPVGPKLDAIVQIAVRNLSPPTHFIFVLDKSWSMQGSRWSALYNSFNAFLKEARRTRAGVDPELTKVSVILFACHAYRLGSTTLQNTAKLNDTIPDRNGDWGTVFTNAFREVDCLLSDLPNASKWDNKIIFLTDGEDNDSQSGSALLTVRQLLDKHWQYIKTYYSISFGSNDQRLLKEIAHEFQQHKVTAYTLDPKDRVQLAEAFVSAASDAPMHRF